MQTLQDAQKSKEVQATAQTFQDAQVNATQWDIYDAYQEDSKAQDADDLLVKDADLEVLNVSAQLHTGSSRIPNSASQLLSQSIDRSASVLTPSEDGNRISVVSSVPNLQSQTRSAGNASSNILAKEEEKESGISSVTSIIIQVETG